MHLTLFLGCSGKEEKKKVNEIKQDTQNDVDHRALLEDVLNYSNLKMLLSRKLSRVL